MRAHRDPPSPTCSVRLYIGSNIPTRKGGARRYQGLPTSFDERSFLARVERLVAKKFEGATFFRTRGVWKREFEDGLMVEVLAGPVRGTCSSLYRRAESVARKVARELGQQAVYLVAKDAAGRVTSGLVSAPPRPRAA